MTKPLVDAGKLVVIGVVQEQHAQRTRLYKQWKKYDFPIVQDSVNALALAVVPVPILLDENGVVMETRLGPRNIKSLVDAPAAKGEAQPSALTATSEETLKSLIAKLETETSPSAHIATADLLMKGADTSKTQKAIEIYTRAIELVSDAADDDPLAGIAHFRLGVAWRKLFDTHEEKDKNAQWFSNAVRHWSLALDQNPNQYIWRRRIQQYGPRQMKPYPFYDWVEQAQREISERGEEPVVLSVALSEAEIASPKRTFTAASADSENPDPNGKITTDKDNIISFHSTVVPGNVKRGATVRVHLSFKPDNGHWNNEAEPMLVWLNTSANEKFSKSSFKWAKSDSATSDELRDFEFEFQTPSDAEESVEISGFALYNVCTDENGQCLFRRKDFTVPITFGSGKK